jgi:hypothetical protein
MDSHHHFNRKRLVAGFRHWGITLSNSNERAPRREGVYLFQKVRSQVLLVATSKPLSAIVSLVNTLVLSSQGLERPGSTDFP